MKWPLMSTAAAFAVLGFQTSHTGYAPPPRVGPKVEGGKGQERARRRLAAKLKANKQIPSGARVTRQQERAVQRSAAKHARVTPAEFGRRKMAVLKKARAE